MPTKTDSTVDCSEKINERKTETKEFVEQLRGQWKSLWSERINDKVRAEDISNKTYDSLRVEQGTIIHATRDFKPLNFKEILEQHKVENPDRYIQPDVNQGGWNKFVKTEIIPLKSQTKKRQRTYVPEKKTGQQPKKGGRGWLHIE